MQMRILLTVAAYFGSLAAVAVLMFFGVLTLAGPHGGLLTSVAGPAVFVVGWGIVIILPMAAARLVWRAMAKRHDPHPPE